MYSKKRTGAFAWRGSRHSQHRPRSGIDRSISRMRPSLVLRNLTRHAWCEQGPAPERDGETRIVDGDDAAGSRPRRERASAVRRRSGTRPLAMAPQPTSRLTVMIPARAKTSAAAQPLDLVARVEVQIHRRLGAWPGPRSREQREPLGDEMLRRPGDRGEVGEREVAAALFHRRREGARPRQRQAGPRQQVPRPRPLVLAPVAQPARSSSASPARGSAAASARATSAAPISCSASAGMVSTTVSRRTSFSGGMLAGRRTACARRTAPAGSSQVPGPAPSRRPLSGVLARGEHERRGGRKHLVGHVLVVERQRQLVESHLLPLSRAGRCRAWRRSGLVSVAWRPWRG